MSPLVACHATRNACRHGIQAFGLLPNKLPGRPYGVYVFRSDHGFDHLGWNSRCEWTVTPGQDLWRVAYIGPVMEDQYVCNALILLDTVDHVTLVTGNLAS